MIDTKSVSLKTNKELGIDGHPWATNAVVPLHIWHQIQTVLAAPQPRKGDG